MSEELRDVIRLAILDTPNVSLHSKYTLSPSFDVAESVISAIESFIATDAGREWLAGLGFVNLDAELESLDSGGFILTWESFEPASELFPAVDEHWHVEMFIPHEGEEGNGVTPSAAFLAAVAAAKEQGDDD